MDRRVLIAGLLGVWPVAVDARKRRNKRRRRRKPVVPPPPPVAPVPPFCAATSLGVPCSRSGFACECDQTIAGAFVCVAIPSVHHEDDCGGCAGTEVCLLRPPLAHCAALCADPR